LLRVLVCSLFLSEQIGHCAVPSSGVVPPRILAMAPRLSTPLQARDRPYLSLPTPHIASRPPCQPSHTAISPGPGGMAFFSHPHAHCPWPCLAGPTPFLHSVPRNIHRSGLPSAKGASPTAADTSIVPFPRWLPRGDRSTTFHRPSGVQPTHWHTLRGVPLTAPGHRFLPPPSRWYTIHSQYGGPGGYSKPLRV
jgi:hypothetical protein